MFKLTEQQKEEIITEYGSSKKFIDVVESVLNELDVIQDEEEYYDVIVACVSSKSTNNLQISACTTKSEINKVFMTTDEIIETELDRKYNNFEDASPSVQAKISEYKRRK